MIEVLWIDDECMTDLGLEVVEMAYDNGINITPMLTYEEGIKAIKNNPMKWCAVILDIDNANAKEGKPSDDFDKARLKISRMQMQEEPYIFIMSGKEQYQTDNSTLSKPDYCGKAIYEKCGDDYNLLFEDIRKIANVSKIYNCQKQYEDVLKIAKSFCGDETWTNLLELLYKINVTKDNTNSDLLNKMRKILEDVMGVLERKDYPYFIETKKKNATLNGLSLNIGKDVTENNGATLNGLSFYLGKDDSVPVYIKRAFHTVTEVTQNGSHNLEVDKDVKGAKAPYLLRSCVFELCNILIWLDSRA